MNKKVFLLAILCAFCVHNASSQEVAYYKLIRANENKNVSGGQFITFVGEQCFESSKYGVSVENGKLLLNKNYSNSRYIVYQGSSYWGSSTTFKFNADKSVLNVTLDNGDIYVYKRDTPPAGQTTCSLIRKKNGGSSSSGGGYTPIPDYPQQQYPQQQYPQQQQDNPQPTPTPTPAPQQERRYPCSICNQTGEVIKDVTYSTHTKYCDKCHKTVFIGHVHGICTACGGKGYTK